ncbi:MAG: F0F1 ATP synthase subunit A [Anaerolineales bacterium]
MEEGRRWRFGLHRWIIFGLIALNYFAISAFPPILPHIQVPAEALSETPLFTLPIIGEFFITNTMVAMIIADIVLILLALAVRRAIAGGGYVFGGIAGAVQAIVEALYELTETTSQKYAKQIFPWVATITLLVLVVNWTELFPGVDSIGFLHHDDHGYPVQTLAQVGDMEVRTIVQPEAGAVEHNGEHAEDLYAVVPWVRVSSTDLNFTFALALISVVMTQIIGVRVLGLSYFNKFFAFKDVFSVWFKPKLGPFDLLTPFIDMFVGVLELIAELAKIVSFGFRLFGNIFAGTVLLFVIGTLVPVFVQTGVLLLEFFVGLVQAIVFGLLTLVFMTMATQSHDDH